MKSSFLEILGRRPVLQGACLFVASFLIAVVFMKVVPTRFYQDTGTDYSAFCSPVAKNILEGKGVVHNDGAPAIHYPPGYPLILVPLFGISKALDIEETRVVSVFNTLGYATTVVLIYFFAACLWGERRAVIAAGLWATYPLNLLFLLYPATEIPFEVLLYSAVFLLCWALRQDELSWRIAFGCGILVGLCMLIRPIALGLSVAFAAGYWLNRRSAAARIRLAAPIVLLAANFLTVLPWEFWVHQKTGRTVLLASLGPSALMDGLTFGAGDKSWRHGIYVPVDVRVVMREIKSQEKSITRYADVATLLSEQFQRRPLAVVTLYLLKTARSWYGTDSQRWELMIAVVQFPYLLLVAFAGWRAWRAGEHIRQVAIIVGVTVLYFWFMNVMGATMVRYSVPSMALLFLLVPGLFTRTGSAEPGEQLLPRSERDPVARSHLVNGGAGVCL